MLKALLDSLEGLDSKYHALYTKGEDGKYHLDTSLIVDNTEDVTGLKNNNAALKAEKLSLQAKLDDIKKLEDDSHISGLEAEKKYEELLEVKTQQADVKIAAAEGKASTAVEQLKASLLDAAVSKLALDLAGESASLLEPHLRGRFQVNEVEGKYVVQITDINNIASGLTPKELGDEFKANKLYAPILKGRDSSGGGSGGGSGGSADEKGGYAKYFDPKSAEYSSEKQYELEQKDKKAHDALVKKYDLDNPYNVA